MVPSAGATGFSLVFYLLALPVQRGVAVGGPECRRTGFFIGFQWVLLVQRGVAVGGPGVLVQLFFHWFSMSCGLAVA